VRNIIYGSSITYHNIDIDHALCFYECFAFFLINILTHLEEEDWWFKETN
jgi:hypothetical protein